MSRYGPTNERFMRHFYGPSGYVKLTDRFDKRRKTMTDTATSTAVTTQVKQETLVRIIELRNQITKLEIQQKELEEDTKNLILAGAKIEDGTHICELKTVAGRRSPKWKEEAIALADKLKGAGYGDKWAEKVKQNTEPSADTLKLDIK